VINRLFETWSRLVTTAQKRWRWVGYGLTALAFLYLCALVIVPREQIQDIAWVSYLRPFFLAMIVYLASLLVQYLVWSRLVSFHHSISWRDLAIYFRVLLLRRLPGGFWHWLDRTAMYTGVTNLTGRVVMLANFLEWSMLLLMAGAIGVAGWPDGPVWLRSLASAALVLAALFLAFNWQPKERRLIFRMAESVWWVGMYTLAWMAGGMILYLFSHTTQMSLPPDSGYTQLSYLRCVWAWAIAGGSSLLMVFIPAGLGVREIALTWLLAPYLPFSAILLVAIIIRLTYAAADMVWGSLGMLFSLRLLRPATVDPPPLHKEG
jgi:hypothetical protein